MRRWPLWLCLALLSGTFISAGALKIADPRAFQEAILDYQMIGVAPAAAWAWWLPWFEVVCAVSLWLPRFRTAGLAGISLMVAAFLAILLSAVARSLTVSCGCFGMAGHDLWTAIIIDALLALACLGVWWMQEFRLAPKPAAEA